MIAVVVALAFWLDRSVAPLSKIGASLIAIALGAALSNAGIVAPTSPVYDAVGGIVTSLAIAWLLLAVSLDDLRKVGSRMMGAFGLAAAGTALGAFVGAFLFAGVFGPDTWRLAGTLTGTYSGGSLNFVAVGRGVGLPDTLFAGAAAADNLTTGLWLGMTLLLPLWLGRFYPTAIPGEEAESGSGEQAEARAAGGGGAGTERAETGRAGTEKAGTGRAGTEKAGEGTPHPFFHRRGLSTLDLSILVATGIVLLVASEVVAGWIPVVPAVLWLTTFALVAGHVGPFRGSPRGAMQLGTLALHFFFVVIGIHSRVEEILAVGVAVFFFTVIVVAIHGLVVFGGGRLLRIDVGTLAVASQASVGGPSSALAVAVSRRWPALVLPGIIMGLVGYAFGNYAGFAVAYLVRGLGVGL